MTLLSIANDVLAEIGLLELTSLVGNADETARRVLACAKAEGQFLYRKHNWSILHREHTFTTTADEENYPVPDDFGRLLVQTAWDRDSYWRVRAGLSPQRWQRQRSALLATPGLYRHFRQIVGPLAGSILVDPVPTTTGEDLVYEYVSNAWCESAAGTGQETWAADTDECRLDHELFKLGLLWRVKRSTGNPYADEKDEADDALRDARVADLSIEDGNLAPCPPGLWPNVLEGSFPAS